MPCVSRLWQYATCGFCPFTPPSPLILHPLPQELFESGLIDALERSTMCCPIEAQERALELTGPVWRAPGLKSVLGQLPFLHKQPHAVGQGRGGGGAAAQQQTWAGSVAGLIG